MDDLIDNLIIYGGGCLLWFLGISVMVWLIFVMSFLVAVVITSILQLLY